MQNYHIYEAIGRGRFSTVYKGRRKATIQYFAVKSCEKAQRPRVLAEVQVLRSAAHEGVLRFYAWYETANHLWLILEYCVGGDLLALLRQDVRVPEASAVGWARDAAAALRYLHAQGVLHCDLKPSNCLLDEDGRLKLAGFGLSRRVADVDAAFDGAAAGGTGSAASGTADVAASGEAGAARRGTPAVMAPELFVPNGVPSFASDAWALGCLLYECVAGRPAFGAQAGPTALGDLVRAVLHDAPPPLPAGDGSEAFRYSDALIDALEGLLTKEPGARLCWPELESHPLFEGALEAEAQTQLPRQRAFEAMCARAAEAEAAQAADAARRAEQARAAAAVGTPPSRQLTPKSLAMAAAAAAAADAADAAEAEASAAASAATPATSSPGLGALHGSSESLSGSHGRRSLRFGGVGVGAEHLREAEHLLRLSTNARRNLVAARAGREDDEDDGGGRHARLSGSGAGGSPLGGVYAPPLPPSLLPGASGSFSATAMAAAQAAASPQPARASAAPGPGDADVALRDADTEVDFSEPLSSAESAAELEEDEEEAAAENGDRRSLTSSDRRSAEDTAAALRLSAAHAARSPRAVPPPSPRAPGSGGPIRVQRVSDAVRMTTTADGRPDSSGVAGSSDPVAFAPSPRRSGSGSMIPEEVLDAALRNAAPATAEEEAPAVASVAEPRASQDKAATLRASAGAAPQPAASPRAAPPSPKLSASVEAPASPQAPPPPSPDAAPRRAQRPPAVEIPGALEASPPGDKATSPARSPVRSPARSPAPRSPLAPSPPAVRVASPRVGSRSAERAPVPAELSEAPVPSEAPPQRAPRRSSSLDAVPVTASPWAQPGAPLPTPSRTPPGVGIGGLGALRARRGAVAAAAASAVATRAAAAAATSPTTQPSDADLASPPPPPPSAVPAPLLAMMWHPSDSAVKPIVANRRIEAVPEPRWDSAALPFRALTLDELLALSPGDLEAFLGAACRALGAHAANAAPAAAGAHVLGYLESLAAHAAAANLLVNSPLAPLLVRLVRGGSAIGTSSSPISPKAAAERSGAASAASRARGAALLGALVRHATFVADDLAAAGALAALADAARDPGGSDRLRRRATSALGELLFYAATQAADAAAAGAAPPPAWALPSGLALALGRVLRDSGDDVAQHYAAKTVENVATAGGAAAAALAVADVASPLAALAASARGEHLRATAASALARLARAAPHADLLLLLADRPGASPARALAAGLGDSAPKAQQAWLNLLNLALCAEIDATAAATSSSPSIQRSNSGNGAVKAPAWPAAGSASVAHDRGVHTALAAVIEAAPQAGPLRSKALLAAALGMRRGGARALAAACAARLPAAAERAARDAATAGDAATSRAAEELRDAVAVAAPRLIEAADDAAASAAASASGTAPLPALSAAAASPLTWLPAAGALLASPYLAACILHDGGDDASVPPLLARLPRLLACSDAAPAFAGQAELRAGVHACLEALSASGAAALAPHAHALLHPLLPALADAAGASRCGDTRFLALRCACDALLALIPAAFPENADSSADSGASAVSALGEATLELLRESLLPRAVAALDDEDPVPLYALKLLSCALEAAPGLVPDAAALGLAAKAFGFLSLEHASNNVHNVRLCLQLAACPDVPTAALAALGAAPRGAAVLRYAFDAGVEAFLEPALGLARASLERHAHEAAVRGPGLDARSLLPCAPVFAALCGAADVAQAELAADCLALLLAAFPEEACGHVLGPGPDGAARLAGVLARAAAEAAEADGEAAAPAHAAALGACGVAVDVAAALRQRNAPAPRRQDAALLAPPLQLLQATARDERVRSAAAAVAGALGTLLHDLAQ